MITQQEMEKRLQECNQNQHRIAAQLNALTEQYNILKAELDKLTVEEQWLEQGIKHFFVGA